ncbi:MAG TPA: PQQ-binding-like beta-propeller repeat protein [Planctomycetota bacterium]|nr:PQQ-binding-like beta-propeller repeat protein [Planctomycetota bacterium]
MKNIVAAAMLAGLFGWASATGVPAGEPAAATAGGPADEAVQVSGIDGGLCLELGFSSPARLRRLAQSGRFLVHGLSPRREAVTAALTELAAEGMSGLASAAHSDLRAVPCADSTVNLLVVEDAQGLLRSGLPAAEIVRVLAPGGAACLGVEPDWAKALEEALAKAGVTGVKTIRKTRTWLVFRKPRPAGMDEWTHLAHGPDGNLVSHDALVAPPTAIRWCTGPAEASPRPASLPGYGGVLQMVSAGGRNFYLLTSGRIVARDAFNGLMLWERSIGPGPEDEVIRVLGSDGRVDQKDMVKQLVAVGDRVYASNQKEISVLEAATGKPLGAIPFQAWHLLVLPDCLIAVGLEAVSCFELPARTQRWSVPRKAQWWELAPPVASGDRVFILRGSELCALDIKTGTAAWKVNAAEKLGKNGKLCFVQGERLLCRTSKAYRVQEFHAFSTRDGAALWTVTAKGTEPPLFAAGRVWIPDANEKQEMLWSAVKPEDGAVDRTLAHPFKGLGLGCHPLAATERFLVGKRPSHFMAWEDGKGFEVPGGRGSCRTGVGLANGQLYLSQTNIPFGCWCGGHAYFPGVTGWAADAPPPAPASEEDRWERGSPTPAAAAPDGRAEDAWPMFRRDGKRSNRTSDTVPAAFGILWNRKLETGKWPETALRNDWALRLPSGHLISGPTVAGGRVFVSLTEAGVAAALDDKDGRVLWTYPTGGRLDVPPSAFRGLSLVGSHDGWVYALDAASGKLAWRFRAAPAERRIVAFGQTESVWPVVGGVLVEGDLAYVIAGRSAESGEGIAVHAVDPIAGKLAWSAQKRLPQGGKFLADLLASDGKSVAVAGYPNGPMRHVFAADLRTGKDASPWSFGSPVPVSFNFLSRNVFGAGPGEYPPCPSAFSDSVRYGPEFRAEPAARDGNVWKGRASNFAARSIGAKPPADKLWEVPFPAGATVEAVVLAGDKVLVALASPPADGKRAGELLLLASKDGAKLASVPLPAAPVLEGLAVAGGRAYLSLEDGTVLCLGGR